jgi:D-threo-aldose 1-dehydrogenase
MSVRIPRFGMGCSGLGNLYRAMSDDEAVAVLATALDRGIDYFDVAPHYGFGLAERRLGMALRDSGHARPMLSTKVGRLLVPTDDRGPRHGFVDADPFEPMFDYRADAVLASYEASLERIGVERVDILLAHDLGELVHGPDAEHHLRAFLDSGYAAMHDLRSTGRIDAIGIGVNETAICERILDEVAIDVILLAGRYTLLEQGALPLLDRCARLGVQVIVGGPFNSGLLVEDQATGPLHYDYQAAPDDLVARVRDLRAICEAYGAALPAAALSFPLRHPAVCSVVAGLASPDQVIQADDWRAARLPANLWKALRRSGLINPAAPAPA